MSAPGSPQQGLQPATVQAPAQEVAKEPNEEGEIVEKEAAVGPPVDPVPAQAAEPVQVVQPEQFTGTSTPANRDGKPPAGGGAA